MRKLNTILSVLLLFICLLHGLMGSFMLLGISSGAGKFLAWIGVGILAAHTVLGLLLTAQTFRASRSGGKLYGKQNALFWARRTSGLAILLMLFFHRQLYFEGCGKSLACQDICPAGIPVEELMSRSNAAAVWKR